MIILWKDKAIFLLFLKIKLFIYIVGRYNNERLSIFGDLSGAINANDCKSK